MAHLTSTIFVGPGEKVRTFDRRADDGGRLVGLYVGDLTIHFRDERSEEALHASIVSLLDALTDLEAASYARLQDPAA